MSARPFVWHSSRFDCGPMLYPWSVTIGKPKDINDYDASFKTLAEAHSYVREHLTNAEAKK